MTTATELDRDSSRALALGLAASRASGYGIFLGHGSDGPAFAPPEHGVLVVGPPRSGKTSSVVVPNVLAANSGAIVASTKVDVLASTARARLVLGPCLLYDPSGKTPTPPGVERVAWSPVTTSATWGGAVLMAEAMVGAARPAGDRGEAAHWTERAGALLACMLHGCALDSAETAGLSPGGPPGALLSARTGGSGLESLVSAVNRHEPDRCRAVLARHGADLALDLLTGILATDPREQSGIWSTASSVLAGYRTPEALASASGRHLDPRQLLAERATLYVAASSDHQRHVAPLIAGMVRDVRNAAYEEAAARQCERAEAGVGRHAASRPRQAPLLLVLDELAGIAPLHDLPTLVAEGASQGVVTLACLQDLTQARARWGVAADGFLTLFGTKLVLPGIGDTRTLEALSLLSGDRDVPQLSTTRGSGLRAAKSATRTVGSTRRRIVPPDAIANAPPRTALAYVGTRSTRVALATSVAIAERGRARDHSPGRER